jgi:hypothetical protein
MEKKNEGSITIEITQEEKEHLIKSIRWSSLTDKMYLWNLLKKLEDS